MTHTDLMNEIGVAVNTTQRLNQNTDHYTKCELMGKIGYLQGVYSYRNSTSKALGKECWGVEYKTFYGAITNPATWQQLDEWLIAVQVLATVTLTVKKICQWCLQVAVV